MDTHANELTQAVGKSMSDEDDDDVPQPRMNWRADVEKHSESVFVHHVFLREEEASKCFTQRTHVQGALSTSFLTVKCESDKTYCAHWWTFTFRPLKSWGRWPEERKRYRYRPARLCFVLSVSI